ncbi:MAG: hypothetical protein PHS45_04785, partial [Bacilli bacterium]|nr:hypothetical protein [Bacilli bacterium]
LICNNFAICKSGCLGQKIVRSFSSQDEKTFSWYEVNARRTMVKFPTNTHMRRNGKRGIFGEIGEFVDALKKLERYQIMDPMPHYIEALEKILTTDNSDLRLRCIETINNSISDEAIKTDEYYLTNIKNIIMNEFKGNGLEYINEIEKYVVNKKESYINMMRKIVIDEIGDACWYVAGSLLASYNASFNDVADYLIGDMVLNETKTVTPNILKYCQSLKDPSCLKEQKKKIDWPLMIIDSLGEEKYRHLDFLADDWEILYKIIGGFYGEPSRETVISHSGELLLVLAAASHQVTDFSIADIISQNVEKLRQRHPTGFSLPVAAARIENNKNYVDDEPDGVIKHNKKLIYGKEAKI